MGLQQSSCQHHSIIKDFLKMSLAISQSQIKMLKLFISSALLCTGLGLAIHPLHAAAQNQPASIATNSDRLPVPKLKSSQEIKRDAKSIIQDEAVWLKSNKYAERHEKLSSFKRELMAEAMAVHSKSHGPEVQVPSSATTLYFAEVDYGLPRSGVAASLYAESLANSATSQAQIDEIYDRLFAKHPNHPVLLASYHNVLLIRYNNEQYQHKLPEASLTKLSQLYDRAIAAQPQNLYLYLDKASHTNTSADTILKIWQEASTKMPNNPEVADKFANLITQMHQEEGVSFDGKPIPAKPLDPKTIATTAQRLETAIAQFPQNIALYDTYTNLYIKTKAPQKALPILQAGLKKGANNPQLHYLIGDIHLLSGAESAAMGSYQKIVEAKVPLCKANMAERFSGLKSPEQQRKMLNWMIQSLQFDSEEPCVEWLAQIGYNPAMNQRFGQEMIAAIRPIAESKNDLGVRALLLGLMQQQQQYEQIVQLGPKFLAADGVQLEVDEFIFYAEGMPRRIAEAHEKLGNLDQAARFYTLAGEYEKQVYSNLPIAQRVSYAANWHLGRIAWQQGKAPKAIALLQTVTAHRLSDWKLTGSDGKEVSYRALAHNLLGEIFQSQGKKAEAKQQFEASAKADTTFQTPKDNLAKLK
jgi:tetratricopeptide (TPR) repeat protein